MIIDKLLELSSEQAVTSSAASTDHINLGAARDIGVSRQMYLMITVNTAAAAAGAATVTFKLQKDDNSSFSSPVDVTASAAIGKADLTAGRAPIYIAIPPGLDEQYVRAYYEVATGPLTAGAFTAQIVDNIQSNKHYPDAL